ncbi:MAG: hypothetical protein ACOYD4_04055 [Solirubrobacterales bacterium]
MKIYKIRNWSEWFENNRSKTVKDLRWVAIPNCHDGEHFSEIMMHPDGAVIFAGWILLVQIASKCTPRGTLVRDDGTAHTDRSLSVKCRCPVSWMTVSLKYLSENTDWLEVQDIAGGCQEGVSVLTASCQAGDEEGKGMELKEVKEHTQNARAVGPSGIRLHGIPASPDEVVAFGKTLNPPKDAETCREFFAHYEGQARTGPGGEMFWITSGDAVVTNWKAKLSSFGGNGSPSRKNGSGAGPSVWELTKVVEAKKELREKMKRRGHEDAMGFRPRAEDAEDYRLLNKEIAALMHQISSRPVST